MKVEVKGKQSQEVDWTKNPQLVTCEGAIILVVADQYVCENGDFAGIIITPFDDYKTGDYSKYFTKDLWKPFHGEITLKND